MAQFEDNQLTLFDNQQEISVAQNLSANLSKI